MDQIHSILTLLGSALRFVLDHWQFISFSVILASLGEASDRIFLTAVQEKWIPMWLWRIGRSSLPSHPVLIGLLAAYLDLPPESGIVAGSSEAYAYWGLSGSFSLIFWGLLRSLGRKADLDLTLPGAETIDIQSSEAHHGS